ncbi:hypothetical protein CONCODRAFT_12937, partial [Conidiobolus coronatus NRRL 28638]
LNRRLISLSDLNQLVKYAAQNGGVFNSPSTTSTTITVNGGAGGSSYRKTETNVVPSVNGIQTPVTTSTDYYTSPPDANGVSTTYLNGKPISTTSGGSPNFGANYGNPFINNLFGGRPQPQGIPNGNSPQLSP